MRCVANSPYRRGRVYNIQSSSLIMKTNNTIFSSFTDNLASFQIDSEYICFGTFANAMEGALRWQLAVKDNSLATLDSKSLCVPVEQGRWNVYADADDEEESEGGVFWHDALSVDVEGIIQQGGDPYYVILDHLDVLLGDEHTKCYRYSLPFNLPFQLIQYDEKFTTRLLQEGVEQTYLDAIYMGFYNFFDFEHCFFVPPQNILELMPIVESKYDLIWQRAIKYNDELKAIYEAESIDQAKELLAEKESRWEAEYKSFLEDCRQFWEARSAKKTSKKYQKWLKGDENFELGFRPRDFIQHQGHEMANEKQIGILKGQGVNLHWEGYEKWSATLYFDSSSDVPKLIALII